MKSSSQQLQHHQTLTIPSPTCIYTISSKQCPSDTHDSHKITPSQKNIQPISCKYCTQNQLSLQLKYCIHTAQQFQEYHRLNYQVCKIKVTIKKVSQSQQQLQNDKKKPSKYFHQQSNQPLQPSQLQLPIPTIYQISNGQLPKTLIDTISKHPNNPPNKLPPNYKTNKIQINAIQTNYNCYNKIYNTNWLLYYLNTQQHVQCQLSNVKILCNQYHVNTHLNNGSIINLTQFYNYQEYQQYFTNAQKIFQMLPSNYNQQIATIKNTNTKTHQKFILYGLYHQERRGQPNKEVIKIIDTLYAHIFDKEGELENVIYLPMNNISNEKYSNMKEKISQSTDNNTKQKEQISTKQPPINTSNHHIRCYSQNIDWHSTIDLQYNLKKIISKLTFSSQPYTHSLLEPKNNQNHYLSHYVVKFSISNMDNFILIVYNHQTLVYNLMEHIIKTDVEEQFNRSQIKQQSNSQQQQQYIVKELSWLSQVHKLKYPNRYYLALFNKYRQLQLSISSYKYHNCIQNNQQFCCIDCTTNNLNTIFPKLSIHEKIKLCKYSLIQLLPIQQILSNHNNNNNYIKNILQIPNQYLKSNPINNNFIIYWIIGLPGPHTTTLYNQLTVKIKNYKVNILQIKQKTKIIEQIKLYLNSSHNLNNNMFQKQKFAFIILDVFFNVNIFQNVVQYFNQNVGDDSYYQLCLLTPQLSQVSTFYNSFEHSTQINTGSKEVDCSQQQLNICKIQTTYAFSLEYLLCTILNLIRNPSSTTAYLHQQSPTTLTLSHILHYISTVYSNIDLPKIVKSSIVSHGDVRLIQFKSKNRAQIHWQSITQSQKQQIVDQLKVLLQLSYKKIIEEDVLLAYFLDNIDNLQYQMDVTGIGQYIMEQTFKVLPYFVQSNKYQLASSIRQLTFINQDSSTHIY